MTFQESVKNAFARYASGQGRAGRSEFWWFGLFTILALAVGSIIDAALGIALVAWVVLLCLMVPSVAVTVRRLHDTNRSGWMYLVSFIPLVGHLVLLVFCLQAGTRGANKYGAPALAVR